KRKGRSREGDLVTTWDSAARRQRDRGWCRPLASRQRQPSGLALRSEEIARRRNPKRIESRPEEPPEMLAIPSQQHVGPARRCEKHGAILARRKDRWKIKTGEIPHDQELLRQGRPRLCGEGWKTAKV